MTVLLYDHAGVPNGRLAQAEQAIARIFVEAGIEMQLLECSTRDDEERTLTVCLRPLGSSDLVVRIEPGVRPDQRRALGFSQGATYASVYYQRVVEFAAVQLASEAEILGCGIAHELGHLLLQSVGHSSRGIMRAEWRKEELRLMSTRGLHFTTGQAGIMRVEINRRTHQLSQSSPDSAFRRASPKRRMAPAIAATPSACGTPRRPEITVRVFNYAGIPSDAMARAEREVTRIFTVQ